MAFLQKFQRFVWLLLVVFFDVIVDFTFERKLVPDWVIVRKVDGGDCR